MGDLFDLPFADDPAPAPEEARPSPHIYSVTELTTAVRALVEGRFGDVWLEGELSNCKRWSTGHLYFTLKDAGAQMKAVMFKTSARALTFDPADGLHVLVRGRVNLYELRSEYQIVCSTMQPQGIGERQLAFEQLKARLEQEGLFARERKRRLPALPRKIGVVTSLDGAALRDIVKILRRRHGNLHLVIRPTRVQGEGAAQDIARGLAAVARVEGVDVVIVGRGGGSVEDLWAFNEEPVARAIVACPVPVISAVGHEVDFTISDFVADVRAATPSNAAELVIGAKHELVRQIHHLGAQLKNAVQRALDQTRGRLHGLAARPGLAGFHGRVIMRARRVAELDHDLGNAAGARLGAGRALVHALEARVSAANPQRRLAGNRARLVAADTRALVVVSEAVGRLDRRFRGLAGRLENLSPLAVLARGYAVCWTADRTRIVREASRSLVGARVRVTLAAGELGCDVVDVTEGRENA